MRSFSTAWQRWLPTLHFCHRLAAVATGARFVFGQAPDGQMQWELSCAVLFAHILSVTRGQDFLRIAGCLAVEIEESDEKFSNCHRSPRPCCLY